MFNQEDQDTQAFMDKILNRQRTPMQKVGNAVGRFGALLTGHKPNEEDGATRLANQMALMQFKNSLPSKPGSGYFMLDENGNPTPVEGVGNRKPMPVGYNPNNQDKTVASTESSRAGIPLKGEQTRLAGKQADFIDQVTGDGDGNTNGMVVPDMNIVGIHAVNPKVQRDLKSNEPENSADAGRSTLAQESINNIDEVIKTLFPTGKPESFQRGIATGSNLPGVRLPLVGRITPSVRPDNPLDKGDDKAAEDAQNVFRNMGTSLSGRQLIQTGVAARPEETQKLVEQFAPGMTSNPQAAFDGLQKLRQFYIDYLGRVNRAGNPGQPQQEQPTQPTVDPMIEQRKQALRAKYANG